MTREMTRPGGAPTPNRAAEQSITDANTVPVADDIPAQLRRRRNAALRLPPLEDGRRDPWLGPRRPLSRQSARAAYFHLEACGLLSELVVDVLRASTDPLEAA